jgi:uroporphyrin-III C-methyltransferase/precorrin-2 dehydrogenase/sirohydrochlorin ferrochelatase/uroporphyrin-III C-methyltransferase
MSGEAAGSIIQKLREHHIDPSKKIALIAQATTPMQQVTVADIYDDADHLLANTFISPSLIIIGKVVNLHAAFAWVPDSEKAEHYFNPIARLATVVTDKKDKATRYAGRA